MELLKKMCGIHATSGDESKMTDFLLDYIKTNSSSWKAQPKVLHNNLMQESIILIFGKPTTAIFAHIDSIGYTAGYAPEVMKIGGPVAIDGMSLVGTDSKGDIECELSVLEQENGTHRLEYIFHREIDRATPLTFKQDWREDDEFVQSCYMDNRLGVYNALKVAETIENGAIVFSCREEHQGGSAEYLGKILFEEYGINQALISDITWVTRGVKHNKGVAISTRDSGIPRRKFLNKIIQLAEESGVNYQLEVESAGGSDANSLQRSSYPWQWCFIGAAEDNVHSPDEKVSKKDIQDMIDLYKFLMKEL